MTAIGSWVLLDGTFQRGALALEDGVPVEFRSGETGDAHPGVVVPAFANAHTHLGDAFIRDPPQGSLRDLVAPPDGYKHRRLREASEEEVFEGMRGAAETTVAGGSTAFADFREGGLAGVRLLLQACLGLPLRPLVLARPAAGEGTPQEWRALLQAADGLGASSIRDVDPAILEQWSAAAHRAEKLFALHASEGTREDIDAILDLRPDFLVHMAKATPADLERCADSGVPVAVCPRSNARFGLKPDVPGMLAAGLTVRLGTDNAMFAPPAMLEEMRYLAGLRWRGTRIPSEAVFRMAVAARKPLREAPSLSVELDQPSDLAVLRKSSGEPTFDTLIADPESSVLAVVHAGALWEVRGKAVTVQGSLGD